MLWPQTIAASMTARRRTFKKQFVAMCTRLCVAMGGSWMCGAQCVAVGGYVLLYVAKCR